jgi:hypothetical protein
MKLLKSLDHQNFKYELTVDKNSSFKTALGGFLLILLTAVSILAFVAFGRDLVNKKNPIIYSSYNKTESQVIPNSQFKGYRLAGAVMYSGGLPIEDQDKMLEFKSVVAITNPANEETTVFKFYDSDTCINRKNYTEVETQDFMSNFIGKPETYKCLSEKIDEDLFGLFGNPEFTIWMFAVNRCVNSTTNDNNCYPDEIISEKLKEFYLHLIFEEYYINSNDYEAPLKRYYNKKIIRLSALSARQDTLIFRAFEYTSDNGFLVESKESYSGHELVNHDKEFYSSNGYEIYVVNLTCDNLNHQIYRVYVKIQKVIADTGGIIKFFSILFSFIGSRYSKLRFYDYMIQRVHLANSKIKEKNLKTNNTVSS